MSIFSRKKDKKPESAGKADTSPSLVEEESSASENLSPDPKGVGKKVTSKTKKEEVVSKEPKTRRALETRRRLVTRPLLTEKATSMEGQQKYVFQVSANANKNEVKKEIEQLFNVEVRSVNIINKKRKSRLWKGKAGWSRGMKKAIITIAEGKKIEILPH